MTFLGFDDARVSTTTRRNCYRDGGGVASGGFRTRTSALTGGGATSTGWTTSVMALGRVAGASEEARGRTDDDTGFRNNHERGIFFLFQNQVSRDDDEQSRSTVRSFRCSRRRLLPPSTRTRVKSNRTAFVLYTSDAPTTHTAIPCSRTFAAAPRTTPAPRESPAPQSPATFDPRSKAPCTPVPTAKNWTPVVPRRA